MDKLDFVEILKTVTHTSSLSRKGKDTDGRQCLQIIMVTGV